MSLDALRRYVENHSVVMPLGFQGEAADVIFFKVASDGAKPGELRDLVIDYKGEFCNVDLLDGREHTYIEIGGWIGDQGMALRLIGLGHLMGLWELLTPKTMFKGMIPQDMVEKMAGEGLVGLQAVNS